MKTKNTLPQERVDGKFPKMLTEEEKCDEA